MVRDGVANIVSRLRECGFEPRKVGHDAWEARCPAHGSLDHALSITRNELNHVVLGCRSNENCQHITIIRALGFTNDHLYAETPDWLISQLRRTAVEPEKRAEMVVTWEPLEIAHDTDNAASPLSSETSHVGPLAPALIAATNGAARSPDHEPSHAAALASDDTADDTVKESPTDALMRMAGVERVILGSDGRSYALVSVNGKAECRELKSKTLRNLLTHAALKATGKLPTQEAIAAVVGVLEASARVRRHSRRRVSAGRARAISFVLFPRPRRSRGADHRDQARWLGTRRRAAGVYSPAPPGSLHCRLPARGGSLELLKKYVNLEEADWPLFIGWLTAALRPVGPHPILVVTGEQGAAKTTMLRVCRRLIDPNASPVRSQPKELRDLMIAARKSWLMAYDNITTLPDVVFQRIVRVGDGHADLRSARSAPTTKRAFSWRERPVIINGITDFVVKADLGDRSFFLRLPPIRRSTRQTEEAFWADFDRDCPMILGGLLDAVSARNADVAGRSSCRGFRGWPMPNAGARPLPAGSAGPRGLLLAPSRPTAPRRMNRRSKSRPWRWP